MIKRKKEARGLGKLEADDQREVVAEAALVVISVEGTEGLDSSVFFVVFQQEGGVVDEDLKDAVGEGLADQHMVDALPLARIAVGTLSAMRATGFDAIVRISSSLLRLNNHIV